MKVVSIKGGAHFLEVLRRSLALALCASLLSSLPAGFAAAEDFSGDSTELMDLEDLVFMEVTSVSKKAQRLTESAAAIYVVTQEDIRRTGVTSIAEALRMVPGLQVARITASSYAITSRGMNGLYANKLLVLMDGRSVYTPSFGGVFWDIQDTVLEDVDRIEVIRGPGATLWGANAVNGVINIITKQARDTQGGLLVAGGGSLDRAFTTLRYGGAGEMGGGAMHYRVYGKASRHAPMEQVDGSDAYDESTAGRIGFRMDWDASDRDVVTFQGDAYVGDYGLTFEGLPALDQPTTTWNSEWDAKGFNLIGRWTRNFTDTSYLTLQSYYDKNDRDSVATGVKRDTFDIELQHGFKWSVGNDLTWGVGYRFTTDEMHNTVTYRFDPEERSVNFYNVFAQNETRLFDEDLRLTLGAKLEYNDFVGGGVEPSARALYMIDQRQSLWGAVSGALQMGSRMEDVRLTQMQLAGPPQINAEVVGNHDLDSQELVAFELGYRVMPVDSVSLDITAFHHEYDKVVSIEAGLVSGPVLYPDAVNPTAMIFQVPLATQMEGWTRGVELAAQWQVLQQWRLAGAYSYIEVEMDPESTTGPLADDENEKAPSHQWNLRSLVDLPSGFQWDTTLYYVGEVETYDISSYYRLDMRLGWKPIPNLDLSLVGQNLLQDQHQEWGTDYGFVNTYVPRSAYAKVTWEF